MLGIFLLLSFHFEPRAYLLALLAASVSPPHLAHSLESVYVYCGAQLSTGTEAQTQVFVVEQLARSPHRALPRPVTRSPFGHSVLIVNVSFSETSRNMLLPSG